MGQLSAIPNLDDLRQARDLLLRQGPQRYSEATGSVRDPILRSWRRAASQAVPTERIALHYLDPRGRSELLCRSAGPVLDRLQEDLDGLGVAIFLSDHQGRILSRRAGSRAERNKLDTACAAEGFDFSERAVGTNAIGTVLEEKSALFVRGGEHFNDLLEPLTCAGAPIRMAHTGRVVGSLALTCAAETTNPMMLTLAVNAARQLEQVMADLDGGRNRALFAALAPRSGQHRAPMVVLTSDAVLSNTAGLQFVTPEQHPLLWQAVSGRCWSADPQTIELDLPAGRVLAVAHRITDPTGDAFRLEFRHQSHSPPASRSADAAPAGSLHPVPAIDDRLQYTAQLPGPIALDGPPGTGKHHVALRIAALDPDRPLRDLDLAARDQTDRRWFTEATNTLTSGGQVILRHLEDLHAGATTELKALTCIATTAPDGTGTGPGRLILVANLKQAPDEVAELVRHTATMVCLPELVHMKEHIPEVARAILAGLPGIAPSTTFSSAARQALMTFSWPSNCRQLRQAMVEVAASKPGWLIQLEQLPIWLRDAARGRQFSGYERAERDAILAALEEAGGNRSKAAELLGIGRTTLYRKIRSLHIECPEQMAPSHNPSAEGGFGLNEG
ncbi:hypothetical protein KVF89_23770 [Nocardioides carbamazepini]|uniref:sigma-54-dependent Fis family transcriptional regulator n=1 Tax=Nocardioides carbamazepini TaxID=2854259 RepID=UPI00214A6EF4|nr:helix-turn-helix domain-containing protein [Nocardioides carbamazepini]MCR1785578.1 hypothetical protein [Nocardioides carbamazepini]